MPYFDTSGYVYVLARPVWNVCTHTCGSDSIITAIWTPELLPQKLRTLMPKKKSILMMNSNFFQDWYSGCEKLGKWNKDTKMIKTFAMNIFQGKVCFISTFLNETAFQF